MSRHVIVGLGEVLWDIFPDERRLGGAPANVAFHVEVLGEEGVIASRVGSDDRDPRSVLVACVVYYVYALYARVCDSVKLTEK